MKLEEALVELRKGKKIRNKHWEKEACWSTDNLSIINALSNDWEVIEEPGKPFNEVFKAFKEGKKIKRKSWGDNQYFILQNDIYSGVSALGSDALLATDWEVME